MARPARASYNTKVNGNRLGRLAAATALWAVVFSIVPARAQTASNVPVDVQNAPVVRVQMRSGSLTIRTWDRSQVLVTSTNPAQVRHFGPRAVERALRGGDIPIFATTVASPRGPITLPPEEFSVAPLSQTPHDGVVVFGGEGATMTVTVPSNTALIVAMVGRGRLSLSDYRSGAFVTRVHAGGLALTNVGGDGYAEVARGVLFARRSAFNRIRARTGMGNIIFESCNARQIEVSSILGSIAYDNGTFAPGLARFETQDGNIALGIAAGAQIGAHSASGQIYSTFGKSGAGSNGTDAQVIAGGGGPVVTASSEHGAVYLYDGAFASRPRLQRQWRPLGKIFKAKTSARRPYPA